ncbi:FK506-binding protein 15 [Rhincodon typus]|uniref:FK506-binding protein 15 n=1 Tax=Rhincodon typus TaxID=259920 RepID=UPI00202FAB7A|nr:FK506-binding protein 15 [Rhincodon typus]
MSLFGADDDDVDFLSPSGGSKLASLFGTDQASAGQGNESFQYTAPKQPKRGTPPPGPGSQKPPATAAPPAVLFATAVHAYQYVNGQYVKQGKLGAAILGNHAAAEYKILLYASQQKRIAAARIYPAFTFTVQANNYCVFYDDQRQNWSVMFDSEKAVVEFSKQVCLAKCSSTSTLESVLIQDLAPGEGQAVETGDSLEVSYTGWLYQNHTFGQVFDTNVNRDKLLRLKIGSGKVIKGWEVGMLGMKKNGRRLLIVPPSLAYGSQGIPNRVPTNATLIFEVEVKRVKFAKESGFDKQSTSSHESTASSPAPSIESLTAETAIPAPVSVPPKPGYEREHVVRAKSNSLSDTLANPDTMKAKLISRMAKMGQPMPFLTGALSAQPDSSDSELEDHSLKATPLAAPSPAPSSVPHTAHPVHNLPPQQPAPVSVSMHASSSAALLPVTLSAQQGLAGSGQTFQPYPGISYGYPPGPAAQTQIQTVAPMFPAQAPQYQAAGDVTSFMMTEARQHNTEIRLAISKASDKIDQLSLKVDDLQKHLNGPSFPGISSVTMETSMIMHNIQRIIQENERLKQEVFDKSSRIEEQNGKISDLIQRNQRYVEQSNLLMEQRNDSLISSTENNQARILLAEQEKTWLASLKQSRQVEEDRLMSLQEQAEELQALKERYSSLQSRAAAMKEHYDSQIRELQQRVPATNEALQSGDTAEEVKKIMNGVFQSLRGEFDLDEMYSGRAVLGVIVNTIKAVTLKLLMSGQDQLITKSDNEDDESEEELEERAAPPIEIKVNTDTSESQNVAALDEKQPTVAEADRISDVTLSPGHSGEVATVKSEHNEADSSKAMQLELQQPEAALTSSLNIPTLAQSLPTADNQEATAETSRKGVINTPTEMKLKPPLSDCQGEKPHQQTEGPEHNRTPEKSHNPLDGVQQCELGNSSVLNSPSAHERQEERSQAPNIESSSRIQGEPLLSEPLQETVPALNGNEDSPEIPEGPVFESSESPSELDALHVAECGSSDTKSMPGLKSKSAPSTNASSLFSDDDDDDEEGLFKALTPKLGKVTKKEEEEDEDEVSMKGRPPPAPLFGDEDEEDDFDWLG